jgi:Ni,Fe-hydrogenase III large subunit
LEATGITAAGRADRLALVGPVARAAGSDIDSRRDHPRPPYEEIRVAHQEAGDALARYRVLLAEIGESVRLIDHFADRPVACADPPVVPQRSGSGLGWAESARGEALAWVQLDTDGRIARTRLRPAAVRNWRAFDDAARSQNVFTDIPIIEASFWLTAAGRAR